MSARQAFFPGRAPIDAYGNGGFRFADMSHRGSLLLLPSGIYAWDVVSLGDLSEASFAPAIAEAAAIEFLLLGTGRTMQLMPPMLGPALRAKGLRVDAMDTGAAARTYNIVLAENRRVAAALIAVD